MHSQYAFKLLPGRFALGSNHDECVKPRLESKETKLLQYSERGLLYKNRTKCEECKHTQKDPSSLGECYGKPISFILLTRPRHSIGSILIIRSIHFWIYIGSEVLMWLANLNRILVRGSGIVQRRCHICCLDKVIRFYRYSKITTIDRRLVALRSRIGSRCIVRNCRKSVIDCWWIRYGRSLNKIRLKRTLTFPRNR